MTNSIDTATSKAPQFVMDGFETHHPKQKKQGARPIRSLVVDDDHTILKFVARLLSGFGYAKVETAQKNPEMMSRLTAGPYDLLVTDLEMPDMNGFHLAQMIKKKMPDTKVIIMTGRNEADCLAMSATRWVDGWLFKPFGFEELREMLKRLGLLGD